MRTKFDSQLEMLNVEMIKMGSLCEEALDSAMKALFEMHDRYVVKTETLEREIDAKERDIESLCMRMLVQQQPVANDLRLISAALRMISDMERIGDQAQDIAELSKTLEREDIVKKVNLHDMAQFASKMVTDSVDSFVKSDLKLAKQVIQDDDVVDKYFDDVKKELMILINEVGHEHENFLDVLMAAKYLERIADHATNIAEWVEYSIVGHKDITE